MVAKYSNGRFSYLYVMTLNRGTSLIRETDKNHFVMQREYFNITTQISSHYFWYIISYFAGGMRQGQHELADSQVGFVIILQYLECYQKMIPLLGYWDLLCDIIKHFQDSEKCFLTILDIWSRNNLYGLSPILLR